MRVIIGSESDKDDLIRLPAPDPKILKALLNSELDPANSTAAIQSTSTSCDGSLDLRHGQASPAMGSAGTQAQQDSDHTTAIPRPPLAELTFIQTSEILDPEMSRPPKEEPQHDISALDYDTSTSYAADNEQAQTTQDIPDVSPLQQAVLPGSIDWADEDTTVSEEKELAKVRALFDKPGRTGVLKTSAGPDLKHPRALTPEQPRPVRALKSDHRQDKTSKRASAERDCDGKAGDTVGPKRGSRRGNRGKQRSQPTPSTTQDDT